LFGQHGKVLGAGVVFQQERGRPAALGPDARPVWPGQPFPVVLPGRRVLVADGGVGLVEPLAQLAAVLAGVPGQGDEEPVPAGHVTQPRGAFQGELPVSLDVRRPSVLGPVLDTEHRRADRAEDVVPRRGPGRRVRPEPAQHAQLHEHAEAVPGGGDVPEPERGELVRGQHPVHGHQTNEVAVTVGQVRGRGQHGSLVLGGCCRPGLVRVRM
jgi:hypothetical protein